MSLAAVRPVFCYLWYAYASRYLAQLQSGETVFLYRENAIIPPGVPVMISGLPGTNKAESGSPCPVDFGVGAGGLVAGCDRCIAMLHNSGSLAWRAREGPRAPHSPQASSVCLSG